MKLSIRRPADRRTGGGDVDASLAAVTANGGSIVVPRTDIGFGWYAAVKDTEGNEIGLYQSKPEA